MRLLFLGSLLVACSASHVTPSVEAGAPLSPEDASAAASSDASDDASADADTDATTPSEIEARPDLPPKDPQLALVERLKGETPLVDDLHELTLGIGGRATGSPAMAKAEAWALDRLRRAGLEEVHAEDYEVRRVWVSKGESALVTAPTDLPEADVALRIAARPMSVGTPPEGIEAPVVDIGDGSKLEGKKAALKGAWALVHTTDTTGHYSYYDAGAFAARVMGRAEEIGAVGVLWMSERKNRMLARMPIRGDGALTKIPALFVEREGGLRLAGLLKDKREVRLKITLDIDAPEKVTEKNVLAEVRGRDPSLPAVLLGAHLDSWELGQGAQDDGCNAALVIDVARQMMRVARSGVRPLRTIRFGLFSGEELGLLGSTAVAKAHHAEIGAMIVFDLGSTKVTGFAASGRLGELRPLLDRSLGRFPSLGPFSHTNEVVWNMDSGSFHAEGIPVLSGNQAWPPYAVDYHAETDTFDKVDQKMLRVNAQIAAVVAWGLAEEKKLPAVRAPK